MWACIFRVKWYTVGIHNAMAQSGLEKNSSGDVSLGKEKAPLLQWIFWLKKSGLMTFLKFVIMQVDLLNICLGQRWNAVMKSRLRVTLQPQSFLVVQNSVKQLIFWKVSQFCRSLVHSLLSWIFIWFSEECALERDCGKHSSENHIKIQLSS